MIYYVSTTMYKVVIGVERHPVLLSFVFLSKFKKKMLEESQEYLSKALHLYIRETSLIIGDELK